MRERFRRDSITRKKEDHAMIQDGSKVKFHYTLKVADQAVASSYGAKPVEYTHGTGSVVAGVEENLTGLATGDRKSFDVPPEKAYGPRDPAAVRKVTRSIFSDPEQIREGETVAGQINNQPVRAVVSQIAGDQVTLDFNHPLAGKTLQFEVEILDVR